MALNVATKVQKLRVTLVELGCSHGTKAERTMFLFPDGARFRAGTAAHADLHLPRARFGDLGQSHFSINYLDGTLTFELYHHELPAKLDGKDAHGAKLERGAHRLELGPHRFELTLH